jgi:hypothetical protein
MMFEIAFFFLLLGGFGYATYKVWRGESEFDKANPPAFWPFSAALWRGTGRAMPALGLGTLIVIGSGITSELVGTDSPAYDWVMAFGAVGLIGLFAVAFPIMYLNRPRRLIPPPWRDDPSTVEEWRAARARRR